MLTLILTLALTIPLLYKYGVPVFTRGKVKYQGKGIPTYFGFGLVFAVFCPPIFWLLVMLIGEGLLGVIYELFLRKLAPPPEFLAAPAMVLFYAFVAHLVFFLISLLIVKVAPKVLSAERLLDVWVASLLPALYSMVLAGAMIYFRDYSSLWP